jgi:ribosomal protein S9
MTQEQTAELTAPAGEKYYAGTGRRKSAVARVRLYAGSGAIVINGKPYQEVFTRPLHQVKVRQPLATTETEGRFNVQAKIAGGGISAWADALAHGWNERLQSFVQYYGAEYTDAALLMMPMVGFLPADDPRMRSTVRRIREELEVNGLLRRYPPQRTDDGFETDEGVFTMCTLWLVGYLTFAGEMDEARRLFDRVLACGNHLGLFSEMIDSVTGEALGNFPQAFTHVSLIHTARNLDIALSNLEQPVAPRKLDHEVGVVGAP